MKIDRRALSLEAQEHDGKVDLALRARSEAALEVQYELEVTGASTTRHKGRTKLAPGKTQTLSMVSTSSASSWCAIVHVEQSDGLSYSLKRGICNHGR